MPVWKRLLFSVVPAVTLLATAEVAFRLAGWADPSLTTIPLPEEKIGILQPDPELFWALVPGASVSYKGGLVEVNSLGLRGPEIPEKADHELRILSLGESTTFGVGVDNVETYTDRLGVLLREAFPDRPVRAINAGVSAYSSFQSLKYLELRGLALRPDVVLFYHELNDYLPSTLRNEGNTEIGVLQTDRQLYESRLDSLQRLLVDRSALLRGLSNQLAYARIQAFGRVEFADPLGAIGLPELPLNARLNDHGKGRRASFNERSLGRRVSDDERLDVLLSLVELCRREGILLVVLHPSYRESSPHECLLTRFCRDHDVVLFDAYDALHPPGRPALYLDGWHPSTVGHQRLAHGLAPIVRELLDPGRLSSLPVPGNRAKGFRPDSRPSTRRGRGPSRGRSRLCTTGLRSGEGFETGRLRR